ncbi:MAG: alpha/beta hydrolase, partial [Chloroflexota bacterium]
PILILGARHDAVTPYAWTQRMSAAFPSAPVVTYEGTQHVTWIAGSDCVREIAERFVIKLRSPAGNVTCPIIRR